MTRATDKQWERLGKEDPYFGVLTNDEFKKENLNFSGVAKSILILL